MRSLIAICILLLLAAALGALAVPAEDGIPMALIFPVTTGEGALPTHSSEATQALRSYFRDSGKLDTTLYDPQSAMVKRAMAENGLKPEDLVGTDSPTARVKIGKLLEMDYVVAGAIKFDTSIKFDLWMANIKSGRVWGFQGEGVIADTGRKDLAVSNAIQMAVSRAVAGASDIVLKDIKAAIPPPITHDPNAVQPSTTPDLAMPADDAKTHIRRAEDAIKTADQATAIQEYRRAIDLDPKNIDIRLKLAQLYAGRQMYPEALDELDRAQALDPKNEAIAQEAERVRKLKTGVEPPPVTQTQESNPITTPSNKVNLRPSKQSEIAAGDASWQKKNFVDAEKHYRLAVAADDKSAISHERLGLLMTALGRFDAAKTELLKIQELQPGLDAKSVGDRYARFEGFAARHIKFMIEQYDTQAQDFAEQRLTREDYYTKSQSLTTRVEALIRLNDVMSPSEAGASAYKHQTAGLSLMSQALTHLVTYLESNKKNELESATIMMTEARKHLTGGAK